MAECGIWQRTLWFPATLFDLEMGTHVLFLDNLHRMVRSMRSNGEQVDTLAEPDEARHVNVCIGGGLLQKHDYLRSR